MRKISPIIVPIIVFLSFFLIFLGVRSEIIVNKEIADNNVLAKLQLVGYRAFPLVGGLAFGVRVRNAAIPVALIFDAASEIPSVKAKFDKLKKKHKTPFQIIESYGVDKVAMNLRQWSYDLVKTGEIAHFLKPIAVRYATSPMKQYYDANFIIGLLTTEMIKDHDIKILTNKEIGMKEIIGGDISRDRWVALDPGVSVDFLRSYSDFQKALYLKSEKVSPYFTLASKKLSKHKKLSELAKLTLAYVTFGKPLWSTAEEKRLNIPDSILSEYDVYYLEFALSVRSFFSEKPQEVTFTVKFSDGTIALELIPLSFGVERSVEEKFSSPKITASVGKAKITVGQIYGQTISFHAIKPTIVANGLQESNISWAMIDDAAGPGSKKFVAIIGVPKGHKKLALEMSAYAKFRSWYGLQGDIAVTEVVSYSISLLR